jgi:hypothetical protein
MEAPQSELQSDALQHHRPNRHLAQDDLGNGLELALGQRLKVNFLNWRYGRVPLCFFDRWGEILDPS